VDSADNDAIKGKVMEAAKKWFKPEFINRLDELVVFRMLERTDLNRIVDLEVSKVISSPQEQEDHRLAQRGCS
jgi:ATP-dependent Clp protease ATP-binding subunit ClpC